jgi:hypothetical protein
MKPLRVTGQGDLLDWQPPEVTAAYAPERVRGATLQGRFARAISETLTDADKRGAGREEIAQRMSAYLGERVSVNMLNAYASVARTDHSIGLPRTLALLHATGDRRLLEMLAAECGWAVIERKHLVLIELAAVQEAEQQLARRARGLRKAAISGGAL